MPRLLQPLLVAGIAFALSAVGVAAAEKPAIVEVGQGPLSVVNIGFAPRTLPKKGKPAPLALNISDTVNQLGGATVPALRELTLDIDRNVGIDTLGMPVCTPTVEVPLAKSCEHATVGWGRVEFEFELPEQLPFRAEGELVAFNRGIKHGKTILGALATLDTPVSRTVALNIEVSKVRRGRFRTRLALSVPELAGGSGSVKSFSLTLHRRYGYRGQERSLVFARCIDGHLDFHATYVFGDGTVEANSIVRSCAPRAGRAPQS